jgi:hypothetical protein
MVRRASRLAVVVRQQGCTLGFWTRWPPLIKSLISGHCPASSDEYGVWAGLAGQHDGLEQIHRRPQKLQGFCMGPVKMMDSFQESMSLFFNRTIIRAAAALHRNIKSVRIEARKLGAVRSLPTYVGIFLKRRHNFCREPGKSAAVFLSCSCSVGAPP